MSARKSPQMHVGFKEFIDENYRLLAAMGGSGGLTALFSRLDGMAMLTLLSFISFLIVSLVVSMKYLATGDCSLIVHAFGISLFFPMGLLLGFMTLKVAFQEQLAGLIPSLVVLGVIGGLTIIWRRYEIVGYISRIVATVLLLIVGILASRAVAYMMEALS